MGTEKVEHARCTFAAVEDSRRVPSERPRWPVVPPPARHRPATPPPSPRVKVGGRAPPPPAPAQVSRAAGDSTALRDTLTHPSKRLVGRKIRAESEDVIDLGAPRKLRRAPAEAPRAARPRRELKPNPRLYPGRLPHGKTNASSKPVENQRPLKQSPGHPHPEKQTPGIRRTENRSAESCGKSEKHRRRRKRVFRRVVPNPRLYRPPQPRPPPPPASPRAHWAPPAPPARLDTASRAALHLSEQRRAPPLAPPQSPQLVVTLPPAGAAPPPSQRYRATGAHFRLLSLDTDSGETTPIADPARPLASMDPPNRHSTSPEDYSEGNETLSAPSEFLAEFLSAIMRRQYAEALKYCRLILQYEPHNATARGFYPLLQHKVQAHQRPDEEWPRGSSSEEASAPVSEPAAPHLKQEMMEQGGDSTEGSEEAGGASRPSSRSGGSCCSQSSLEMDSSEALAHSSLSLSLSRRTERTEYTDSASGDVCESVGSASRSDADDNGNAPASASAPAPASAPGAATARLCAGDVENDNAAVAPEPLSGAHLKADSLASLRRLRAQFTCSIK